MQQSANTSDRVIVSYLTLRKVVGILGISLPFILALGGFWLFKTGRLEASISGYYYTGMGDVFVGTLCVIGFFLFSYKGHEPKDDRAGDLACIFAVGVALFPTTCDLSTVLPDIPCTVNKLVGGAHLIFASAFFLTLAYFSLVLFTKTDPNKPRTPRKKIRDRVYRICGFTILGAMALIGLWALLPSSVQDVLRAGKPVFWLESAAVVAFGFSWLTKGGALWWDLVEQPAE